jgi:predicted nucleic acid-binding Zn ribbon protein
VPPQKRCIWCGSSENVRDVRFNPGDRIKVSFCSDRCQEAARRFLEFDTKYSKTFYLAEFTLAILGIAFVFTRLNLYAALSGAAIGLMMVPFPFLATILGGVTFIKRSIMTVRVVGVVIALAGVTFAFL